MSVTQKHIVRICVTLQYSSTHPRVYVCVCVKMSIQRMLALNCGAFQSLYVCVRYNTICRLLREYVRERYMNVYE